MSNVDQIPSSDLRGHFDNIELVDSEALIQPESNGNEQSHVESAEELSRVVAPINCIDLPTPAMKISHLPKIDQILDCRLADDSHLNKVEILSRAGKVTGANKFFMNVSQRSKTMCLDFEKEVKSWEVIYDTPKQCTQQSFLARIQSAYNSPQKKTKRGKSY